jgi:hypothetical protein
MGGANGVPMSGCIACTSSRVPDSGYKTRRIPHGKLSGIGLKMSDHHDGLEIISNIHTLGVAESL